jgi:dimethylhistidine N-methyltransferase
MNSPVKLIDYAPATGDILGEVLEGLRRSPKELPPKYFYDERGSELFTRITQLPEYYPTRTEAKIMRDNGAEIARIIGPDALIIEYGSGNSEKTRILLDHLDDPAGYVPIDISGDHLLESATELATEYPGLAVLPVCADYDQPFEIPSPDHTVRRRVIYFPGSTIGNFHPDEAVDFLRGMIAHAGPRCSLLIGVDLKKDSETLTQAYNDSQGVTAAFNINMLLRLNTEVGSNFDVEHFRHRAIYNEEAGRVEMHLVSNIDQTVTVGGYEIHFDAGESIWTESSYKYSVDEFAQLARRAGFEQQEVWTDSANLFSVQHLTVR